LPAFVLMAERTVFSLTFFEPVMLTDFTISTSPDAGYDNAQQHNVNISGSITLFNVAPCMPYTPKALLHHYTKNCR